MTLGQMVNYTINLGLIFPINILIGYSRLCFNLVDIRLDPICCQLSDSGSEPFIIPGFYNNFYSYLQVFVRVQDNLESM